MASREDAEPPSRMDGRAAWGEGLGREATGRLAFLPLAAVRPAVVRLGVACVEEGRFEGRLEELTPELPDLADWVGHGPQANDRPGRGVHDGDVLGFGYAFRVDTDHPQVHAPL